ncbi:MAG: hypothetical protein K9L68_03720 [Spirochaetales bacterium]|nr:hypothetical protein [Spirochaetales bacterium]MCF7937687.1 hypothetical protein [Spirochaetales bacterium]
MRGTTRRHGLIPFVLFLLLTLVPASFGEPAQTLDLETAKFGVSVEGRPLESVRMGSGPQKLVLIGGIHGGYEWNTIDLVRRFITYFKENPEAVPSKLSLYLVPNANPDGLARISGSRELPEPGLPVSEIRPGRFNANWVDLNRNWDKNWQQEAWWGTTRVSGGTAPFSEPETRALRDLLLELKPELVIWYHSAANGIFYGGSRFPDSPSREPAERYAEASNYRIPEGGLVSYPVTGAAGGWLFEQGIPSMVVELAGRQSPEFERNLQGLEAVLSWF